jgi:tetratricopeptide (TPR) repeat protein
MSKPVSSALPRLTQEQRLACAGQFERATQVLHTGDLDYGMQLLLNCCLIDPANPTYRQTLRQAQKAKYQDNRKGQTLAFLTTLRAKIRLNAALRTGNYPKALEHAEAVLQRNPWDVGTHMAMAEAFENLDLVGMAIWTLDQIRQVTPSNPKVNRKLARLFEKSGNFTAATAMWELVRQADPTDVEAQYKFNDLAASATIARGRYEDAIQGSVPSPAMSATGEMAVARPGADKEDAPAPGARLSHEASADGAGLGGDEKEPREVVALKAKIAANPTLPNAYLHLAGVYRRAEQWDQARQVLRLGLGPTANDFAIAMELADLDIEPFRRDLAVAEEKLSRRPDDPELEAIRAGLAKEVATRELDYYRAQSDRYPTDNKARFEMGVRLCQCGQLDEAIRELQAVRSDPRHQGKALVYLGYCFKKRNNWRLAQRNFEDALGHISGADEGLRKEVFYELAKGYAAAGELTRAVDMACELANIDFGYKDIGKLLDDWNAKLQKA